MARNDPTICPPTSGKLSHPGSGLTLPFRSTSTGYFIKCPFISVTSSDANCFQFASPIDLTFLTQSTLSGLEKQSSMVPRCSAHKDILYPQIYKIIHSNIAASQEKKSCAFGTLSKCAQKIETNSAGRDGVSTHLFVFSKFQEVI